MRRKRNTHTETKTLTENGKHNTLTENTIHLQKTQYTRRKQNTLAENRIHSQKRKDSQKAEYTHRKQNILPKYNTDIFFKFRTKQCMNYGFGG